MKYKELEKKIARFQHHLADYQKRTDKKHSGLDEQMAVLRADLKEISIRGLHKQDELVHKHYMQYIKSNAEEDFTALENDLTTLLDYISEHDAHH